ncbi:hypothetical protein Golob_026529 [Gossypium lobatum]|uniref:Uncharacterized protein n=1 Tax=Gossypium lobatum TaxID=34289 RepID=A0A7J8LVE6_9ROSI|nr:hypothetical protein [Gossypium lobatum]
MVRGLNGSWMRGSKMVVELVNFF